MWNKTNKFDCFKNSLFIKTTTMDTEFLTELKGKFQFTNENDINKLYNGAKQQKSLDKMILPLLEKHVEKEEDIVEVFHLIIHILDKVQPGFLKEFEELNGLETLRRDVRHFVGPIKHLKQGDKPCSKFKFCVRNPGTEEFNEEIDGNSVTDAMNICATCDMFQIVHNSCSSYKPENFKLCSNCGHENHMKSKYNYKCYQCGGHLEYGIQCAICGLDEHDHKKCDGFKFDDSNFTVNYERFLKRCEDICENCGLDRLKHTMEGEACYKFESDQRGGCLHCPYGINEHISDYRDKNNVDYKKKLSIIQRLDENQDKILKLGEQIKRMSVEIANIKDGVKQLDIIELTGIQNRFHELSLNYNKCVQEHENLQKNQDYRAFCEHQRLFSLY